MEVLASLIGAIVAEPCRYAFGCVQASSKNFIKRKSNFNDLKNDMSSLMNLRKEVQQKLDLTHQLGDVPRSQVKDWTKQVDALKVEVDVFLSTISTSDGDYLQDSCCPFPLQCKVSNELARNIKEVAQLKQAGNELFKQMVDVGVKTKPVEHVGAKTKPVEHIPGPSIIGQKTALDNLHTVSKLLRDDKVSRIGIWGMGGVGKTTLIINLNNEYEKDSAQPFKVVIWATVSKDTNLRKIQTRIAERLKMKLNMEQNEESIKLELHDRLLMERPFLLILDDVWSHIDLDLLGIPRRELCPLSKIIITSRLLNVCRMMDTQTDFKVKALNDEEAWELFCDRAGEIVKEEHIKPVAKMVSKECDGLPLAINIVGGSMKNKSMIELWNETLRALQTSSPTEEIIKDKVFKILKWSYDSIENKRTKLCFLFCCLYPEDFQIQVDELVRYWFCEGLLDECLNYEEIKNQGIATIHKLRDSCLLEPGISENRVKMHDVVRDVGIWIAESAEDECKSLVRSGIRLTCISKNESYSSCKRVSFMNNQIDNLPDCVVQCEEVSTLLLQGNENLYTIPASFLEGFQALKILDLTESKITSLPSLSLLHQLRALVLSGCRLLEELPPLDGLRMLLLLDCSFSGLTKLPQSLDNLSNLRQLDLSGTSNLQTIPYSALSKLYNLESLKLLCDGRMEGQRLSEVLPLLKRLSVLYASLDSIGHLTSNKRIKEFQITIGTNRIHKKYSIMLQNSVVLFDVYLSLESIGWLLCNADNLEFHSCRGLTEMLNKWVTDNVSFVSLRKLEISHCDIDCRGGVASVDLLPNLEDIILEYWSELESISDFSKLVGLKFSRLKSIIISRCRELKCVISLEENRTLEKLEVIEVSHCEKLKSLFEYPRAPHRNLNPTAPNLRTVTLIDLPKLESLWRNDESWQNLQWLQLRGCYGIRKLPLTAQNAESIEEIIGEEEWWNRLKWDSEDTKLLFQNCFVASSIDPP